MTFCLNKTCQMDGRIFAFFGEKQQKKKTERRRKTTRHKTRFGEAKTKKMRLVFIFGRKRHFCCKYSVFFLLIAEYERLNQ